MNKLLTVQSSGDLGPSRVVERPKIIYNAPKKKFVMWMHIDSSSYDEAKVGVATSDTVCGAYTYMLVVEFLYVGRAIKTDLLVYLQKFRPAARVPIP